MVRRLVRQMTQTSSSRGHGAGWTGIVRRSAREVDTIGKVYRNAREAGLFRCVAALEKSAGKDDEQKWLQIKIRGEAD